MTMKNIYFANCVKIQNELFFVATIGDRIIKDFWAKMNVDNKKIECCDSVKEDNEESASVFIDFYDVFQGKIYALDSGRNAVEVFDPERCQYQYIRLDGPHKEWDSFAAFERYGTSYFFFSKYDNKIRVFHTEKNDISEITECFDNAEGVQCACRIGNDVWVLPKKVARIYCYDLVDGHIKAYKLGEILHNCVHSIFGDDGSIYILNMYGIIYRWDMEEKRLYEISSLETEHDKTESMSRIIYAGDKLILLPGYGSDIKIYDILTGKSTVYNEYPKDFRYQLEWLKYYGYCEDERYYYFAMTSANYLLKIEKKSGDLLWTKPDLDLLGTKMIEQYSKAGNNMFCEGWFEITDLLQTEILHNLVTDRKNYGKKIYDLLD